MNLLGNPQWGQYVELDPVVGNSRLRESGVTLDAINTQLLTKSVAAVATLYNVPRALILAAQGLLAKYATQSASAPGLVPTLSLKRAPHSLSSSKDDNT